MTKYLMKYQMTQYGMTVHCKFHSVLTPLLSCIITCTCGQAVLGQGSLDVVHRVDGASVRGIIRKTDANQITVDVRGTAQVVPVNEIRQVVYAQEPNQLRRVRDLIENGQLESALDTLTRMENERIRRAEIQQEVEYAKLYCQAKLALATGNDIRSVVPGLITFIKNNGDNYHYYEAVSLLGDLAVGMGRYAVAARYYGELQRASWPELRLEGLLKQADAQLAEGNHTGAADTYQSAVAVEVSSAEANRMKTLAEIGLARCQAEAGQPVEALSRLERIIEDNSPEDVEMFAKAYNAVGAAYRNNNQVQDAILAYLHTDLLFHRAGEAHAESLHYLSQLWESTNHSERARQARGTLQSRYPASRWVRR
jgi:tetratricopeptide (TPR) repeat protein